MDEFEATKYQRCKEYMEKHYGVTPENIDEKLEEVKLKYYKMVGGE